MDWFPLAALGSLRSEAEAIHATAAAYEIDCFAALAMTSVPDAVERDAVATVTMQGGGDRLDGAEGEPPAPQIGTA